MPQEQERKTPQELAKELASTTEDDSRFGARRAGIRAPRHVSKAKADADAAGLIGGTGTSGAGASGGAYGRPGHGGIPDQDAANTILGSEPHPDALPADKDRESDG
jgi:hypothetical protein